MCTVSHWSASCLQLLLQAGEHLLSLLLCRGEHLLHLSDLWDVVAQHVLHSIPERGRAGRAAHTRASQAHLDHSRLCLKGSAEEGRKKGGKIVCESVCVWGGKSVVKASKGRETEQRRSFSSSARPETHTKKMSPPSSCTAGLILVSSSSLIMATTSSSSGRISVSAAFLGVAMMGVP